MQIQLSELGFFISQIVLVPVYLLATKKVFNAGVKKGAMVGYLLISPFFVYIYSIFVYGILSLILRNFISFEAYSIIVSYGDVLALFISFIFAGIYSMHGDSNERRMRFFVYTCFYMTGMVFTLTYKTTINAVIFSIIVPALTALLIYRYIVLPLAEIFDSRQYFYPFMLVLPMVSEFLMVLRLVLGVVSTQDPTLKKYDSLLNSYMTLFGYLVLLTLFVATSMICRDIRQIEVINESREETILATKSKQRLIFDMLKALVATIEAKDFYTNGHSSRVADYSKMIAERLNLPENEVQQVYSAGLLHDIGKIAIPDAIINKPSSLTDDEYAQIKTHPIRGAAILKCIEELPFLYQGANYHHERWDGRGYPERISGDDIPFIAQIISVADAYDAMTSNRAYRSTLSQDQVRKEIEKGVGTQFSPKPAQAMLSIIDEDTDYRLNGVQK